MPPLAPKARPERAPPDCHQPELPLFCVRALPERINRASRTDPPQSNQRGEARSAQAAQLAPPSIFNSWPCRATHGRAGQGRGRRGGGGACCPSHIKSLKLRRGEAGRTFFYSALLCFAHGIIRKNLELSAKKGGRFFNRPTHTIPFPVPRSSRPGIPRMPGLTVPRPCSQPPEQFAHVSPHGSRGRA